MPVGRPILHDKAPPLNVSELAQPLPEALHVGGIDRLRRPIEHADAIELLGLRRVRQTHHCCPAKERGKGKRDETHLDWLHATSVIVSASR